MTGTRGPVLPGLLGEASGSWPGLTGIPEAPLAHRILMNESDGVLKDSGEALGPWLVAMGP
jgi:hypothetical protein